MLLWKLFIMLNSFRLQVNLCYKWAYKKVDLQKIRFIYLAANYNVDGQPAIDLASFGS